jgi:hypothetical protein
MPNRPQFSLAAILVAMTATCIAFASWAWASGDAKLLVMPVAAAFCGGLAIRHGFYWGLGIAVAIVLVNALLMEKDPSGLGPNEIVIPFHLVVFAIPVFGAAWLGSKLRDMLILA